MSGRKGYSNYFESWTPAVMEQDQEDGLDEMFMNSSLDPRIECAMPILNRLKKNLSSSPMLPHVQELEEWADSVIDMDKDAMPMDMKPAELGEEEKIAGRHDPADFDDMVKRVGVKAKKKPVDMTDLARRLHAAMAKDKKKEEKTDEGLAGATMGGIAGAVLTKSPSGAMTGASMGSDIEDVIKNESLELIADPLLRFKKLSGL